MTQQNLINWIVRELPEWAKDMDMASRILASRGMPASEFAEYLSPALNKIPDPAKTCPGAVECASAFVDLIQQKKKVLLWTDYDVDGICSSAILFYFFDKRTEYKLHVPHRDEGYGLRLENLEKVVQEFSPDVVVCADCGSSSRDEVAWLKSKGIETIILDHHEAKQEPNTLYCNPFLSDNPWKYTCAACVCWIVCGLAETMLKKAGYTSRNRKDWTVIAAIATVADVMPLEGVNRHIVHHGVKALPDMDNFGMQYLLAHFKKPAPKAVDIGFSIGPCINAAGRISSPYEALKLFIHNDEESSYNTAKELIELNTERKALEAEAVSEITISGNQVACGKWLKGLVGILAGRLCEKSGLPSIVFTEIDGHFHGSGRAPETYSLIDILHMCRRQVEFEYGGHKQAAGVTVSQANLEAFKKAFHAAIDAYPAATPEVLIDLELEGKDLTLGLLESFQTLEPFGQKNPEPTILLRNVKLKEFKTMGNDVHLSMYVYTPDGYRFRAHAWKMGSELDYIKKNFSTTDLLCKVKPPYLQTSSIVELEIISMREVEINN